MSIIINFNFFAGRDSIPEYTEYKREDTCNHLTNSKESKKIDYKYYICDYCGARIKILDKHYEMSGGIIEIPQTLTKTKRVKLCLCNKCIKPVIQELEAKQ